MGIVCDLVLVGSIAYALHRSMVYRVTNKYYYIPLVTAQEWKAFDNGTCLYYDFAKVANEIVKEHSPLQRFLMGAFAGTVIETSGIRTEVDVVKDIILPIEAIYTGGNTNSFVSGALIKMSDNVKLNLASVAWDHEAFKQMHQITTGFASMTRWEAFAWEIAVGEYRDVAYRRRNRNKS